MPRQAQLEPLVRPLRHGVIERTCSRHTTCRSIDQSPCPSLSLTLVDLNIASSPRPSKNQKKITSVSCSFAFAFAFAPQSAILAAQGGSPGASVQSLAHRVWTPRKENNKRDATDLVVVSSSSSPSVPCSPFLSSTVDAGTAGATANRAPWTTASARKSSIRRRRS